MVLARRCHMLGTALMLALVFWLFVGSTQCQMPDRAAGVSIASPQLHNISVSHPHSFLTVSELPGARHRASSFRQRVDLHEQALESAAQRKRRHGGWPFGGPERPKCSASARSLLKRCLPHIEAGLKAKMEEICAPKEPADCRLKLLEILTSGDFHSLELHSVETSILHEAQELTIELLLPGPHDIRVVTFIIYFMREAARGTQACSTLQPMDVLRLALCDLHESRASDRLLARASGAFGLGRSEGFWRSAARKLQAHLGGVRDKMVEISETLSKLMLKFLLWTLEFPRSAYFQNLLCSAGRICQRLVQRLIRRIYVIPYSSDFRQSEGSPQSLVTAMERYVTILTNRRYPRLARGFAVGAASYTTTLLARHLATNLKISKVTSLFTPAEESGETLWGNVRAAIFGK